MQTTNVSRMKNVFASTTRVRTFSDSELRKKKGGEIPPTMLTWLKRKRSPGKVDDQTNIQKQHRTEATTS